MMQLSDHSRNLLLHTFSLWDVQQEYRGSRDIPVSLKQEYRGHVYGYLVQGWPPGSFYTAVFANDFAGVMAHSHPSNRIDTLKYLSGWIQNHMPEQARGSYDAVEKWLGMSDDDRRTALEQAKLIYDVKTEVWLILKNEHTSDPYLSAYDWAVE